MPEGGPPRRSDLVRQLPPLQVGFQWSSGCSPTLPGIKGLSHGSLEGLVGPFTKPCSTVHDLSQETEVMTSGEPWVLKIVHHRLGGGLASLVLNGYCLHRLGKVIGHRQTPADAIPGFREGSDEVHPDHVPC